MSALNTLTSHGCPADVATEIVPHLEAHQIDAAKLVPKAVLPNFNWPGLAGLIRKFGAPLVVQVLQGLFPAPAATPASQVEGGSPKVPGS